MNLLSTQTTNIPLHCNVCPKRPNFSDVSHLLTHIASKGHLSCYYKVKVKASTDHEAKRLVDDYDDWYADFNLEELMRERMSQKEKKRGPGSNGNARRASGGSGRNTPVPTRQRPAQPLRDNMHLVDPALSRRFSNEPLTRSDTPNSIYSMDMPRSFQSHLQNTWAPNGYPFADSPLVKQESMSSEYDEDEDPPFEPNPRRAPRRRRRQQNQSDSIASYIEDELIDGLANDIAKLKGVIWPGMDIFDSATPEMRRKRNQKKAISVLQALQATSKVVEPTECVYDIGGILRKEREITGLPESEDDLIEGESEPEPEMTEKKRPRRTRQRPALVEKNVNTGRVTRNRGQPHHPSARRTKKASYYEEFEDDDYLTFSQPPPKKRTGLSIHRDNSGPDITFNNPAPLDVLTASFRDPFQASPHPLNHPQPAQSGFHVPRSQAQDVSWGQASGSFRPTSNGNGMSAPSYTNFGQYLHQGVPQAGGNIMSNPLAPHPQQLGFGPQPINTGNALFSHHGNASWDMFGLDHPDFGFMGNTDVNVGTAAEGSSMNPLFFKEDDDATISAPNSEQEN